MLIIKYRHKVTLADGFNLQSHMEVWLTRIQSICHIICGVVMHGDTLGKCMMEFAEISDDLFDVDHKNIVSML